MEKLTVFQKFDDVETKRMQVVFLANLGYTVPMIQQHVDYAESTIKTVIRKYFYLLEEAEEMFAHVSREQQKEMNGKRELCYLFKFYDADGLLICSKVGTTTRTIQIRLKEELKSYANSKNEHIATIDHAEICCVFDCGTMPAEGAESHIRAEFIKKHPEAFLKNDRFVDVDIPTVTFRRMLKTWLEGRGQEIPCPA
jgi:hypothetical protein